MQSPTKRIRILWLAGLLATVSAVVAAFMILNDAVGDFAECAAEIRGSTSSPDSKKTAIVFGMECGATVPFNTQMSIAQDVQSFSHEKSPAFLVVEGKHDLAIRWIDEKAVEVGIPSGVQVFKREQSSDGVAVKYR